MTEEKVIEQILEMDRAEMKLSEVRKTLRRMLSKEGRQKLEEAQKPLWLEHNQRLCCLVSTSAECKCGLKWCIDCEGKEPLVDGSEIIKCRFCGELVLPSDYCA